MNALRLTRTNLRNRPKAIRKIKKENDGIVPLSHPSVYEIQEIVHDLTKHNCDVRLNKNDY